MDQTLMLPQDAYNRALIQNVHPSGWVNPKPAPKYNLVVIGAGPAGLILAAVGAGLGAKVALIERDLMGGDCLNVGCVPSKAILRAARAWAGVRHAAEFGVRASEGVTYDFGAVMERMRRLRATLSNVDSAHRYTKMGVDVFIGEGRLMGPDAIEVGGERLRFVRAAICTGARAMAPPIPGLSEAGYFTNETLFSLTQLPQRLCVIGAGPIGCEMAQAFARFGSRVTLIEKMTRILSREDADAARIVQDALRRDGVEMIFEGDITQIKASGGEKQIDYQVGGRGERGGRGGSLTVDAILVGIGRVPNMKGLGLEAAGVDFDVQRGIVVDAQLRTTCPKIYAAGDVCSSFQFTHVADAMAQIVIQNSLFPHPFGLGYATTDALMTSIPWCTYTDPEIAHVGLSESAARTQGMEIDTHTVGLHEVDRAVLDSEEAGFARLHLQRGTDRMVGATIVAAHAGELIGQFALALRAGIGVGTICRTIYPYPTQAEVIKKVANAWRRTTFTGGKKRILERWFRFVRSSPREPRH